MMSVEKIDVRINHCGRVYCVGAGCYDELMNGLSTELHFDLATVRLSYVDEEGDRVTVKCSADFEEAVRVSRIAEQKTLSLDLIGTQLCPLPDDEEEKRMTKEGVASCNEETLQLIETLQKKLEANLREIQSISVFLDNNGVRISQGLHATPHLPDQDEKPVEISPEPLEVKKDEEESFVVVSRDDDAPAASDQTKVEEDGGIVNTCNEASKKVMDQCVQVATSIPSSTNQVAASVSEQCQALFNESCAKTAKETAHQAEVSQSETRDVVNLVQTTTDKLLDQQQRDCDDAALKKARELAEEVQRICTALSKETSDSCQAITRCVSEMVRNM